MKRAHRSRDAATLRAVAAVGALLALGCGEESPQPVAPPSTAMLIGCWQPLETLIYDCFEADGSYRLANVSRGEVLRGRWTLMCAEWRAEQPSYTVRVTWGDAPDQSDVETMTITQAGTTPYSGDRAVLVGGVGGPEGAVVERSMVTPEDAFRTLQILEQAAH